MNGALMRRPLTSDDLAACPTLAAIPGWTAGAWTLGAALPGDGQYDDAIATLTPTPNLQSIQTTTGLQPTQVVLTSYDFDGRTDEQRADWANRKAAEVIMDAQRAAEAAALAATQTGS